MKNELMNEYKNREIIGGVFGIRNKITGKVLLMSAPNIEGKEQRFNFAVNASAGAAYMPLQQDWKKYGAGAFEYIQYETLKKKNETDYEFAQLIKELYEKWKEKLSEFLL
ncbi:MAG: GIY-YIG nuclease family protein [Clostridia bacterium]|nr:GIY-YIG nuclease family protein [Clostridia bacterium]